MSDFLFISRLIPEQMDNEVRSKMMSTMDDAAIAWQHHIIQGIEENINKPVKLLNFLPVRAYPKYYKDIYIKRSEFAHSPGAEDINLPFFNFAGVFEGATILNIILYQSIAFIIVFSLLMIIFRIVLSITGVIEKILKFTIILAIPSKIGGFIVGIIEGYIIMFIALFILSQPFLKIDVVEQSKLREPILNSSPILSNIVSSTNAAIRDIYNLEKEFIETKNVEYFNNETARILIDYKIVDKEYINELNQKGKINVNID